MPLLRLSKILLSTLVYLPLLIAQYSTEHKEIIIVQAMQHYQILKTLHEQLVNYSAIKP